MAKCDNAKIIVITGPTATGKTLIGAELAASLGGEVVSADSMQIYRHMDIGTAKPTDEEMGGIPHHMINIVTPPEDYSVARYVCEASACIDDILSKGKTPVVVGGSGLYVDSLIRGRVFSSQGNPELRRTLEERYDRIGGRAMLFELSSRDSISAQRLHENDKKRIVRALEIAMSSEESISEHDKQEKNLPDKYDCVKFALTFHKREVLYDRIRGRVDSMVSAGLIDEVKALLRRGIPRTCTAMQAIGYKEIAKALDCGEDMDAAIALVKQKSTQYAKRQLTWLRSGKHVQWIYHDDAPDIKAATQSILSGVIR